MIAPEPQWADFKNNARRKGSFESAFHHFVEQLEVAHSLAPNEVMTLENLIENLKEIRCGRYRIIEEVPAP